MGFACTVKRTAVVIAALMLAVLLMAVSQGADVAFAATGNLAAGSVAPSTAGTSVSKSEVAKVGNMDKYIRLQPWQWVIATGNTTVPVFKSASDKSRRIASFQGRSCIVVDMSGMKTGTNYQWLKVKLKGKRRGYVKLSSVSLQVVDTQTFGLNTSSGDASEARGNKLRAAICRFGLKYLGTRYSHGSSLTRGLHCGSFAKKCFNKYGFKFKSADVKYLGKRGKAVVRENLKPGDMVFYRSGRTKYGHVAIYIGYGLIVNSSGKYGTVYPRGGIRVSTLDYRNPHPFAFRNIVGN